MLIIGAGACARDLLAMLLIEDPDQQLTFFDDVTSGMPDFLYGKFKILKSEEAAEKYFEENNSDYVLGVGNPVIRSKMSKRFDRLGGDLISVISRQARVGPFNKISSRGVIIMHGTILTSEVEIGEGSLINMNNTLGHYCQVGRYCDLAPGVYASSSRIGDYCQVGINAVIKPGVNIGRQVTVGAGSVVTKDVPDYQIVAGVPAVPIGENTPYEPE